mmetsp:Transcript_14690/g.22386  ORF Transcript_14690/g.22386 Transcript_14690/m.22386 type:complete len:190 (-) Transcript_14690:172-741(-)|eukprot:CAMPEP_0118705930 /NCGR_PEP_ID=MMETSP0800-20121206/20213_1 /TAXON_ID=210618 ORGANISM="Striatella unipunctata, Strain CCMP2910" /NCGR_SAMPLE_ID=MMETSP0800 /ASSEMBLY_ACC=CAM_ASM_000638 /LENGTH=189 /DNA_ID=CAMNT_0006608283 /DNA_START=94 /DNA_END=663 /DNA_ORIENTATION=+
MAQNKSSMNVDYRPVQTKDNTDIEAGTTTHTSTTNTTTTTQPTTAVTTTITPTATATSTANTTPVITATTTTAKDDDDDDEKKTMKPETLPPALVVVDGSNVAYTEREMRLAAGIGTGIVTGLILCLPLGVVLGFVAAHLVKKDNKVGEMARGIGEISLAVRDKYRELKKRRRGAQVQAQPTTAKEVFP